MWRNYNPVTLYQDGYDWTGRTSRSQLLVVLIFVGLVCLPLLTLDSFGNAARIVEITAWVALSLLTVPVVGHFVRRFNQMRWPAGLTLLYLLPFVSVVLLAIQLLKNQGQRRLYEMSFARTAGFYAAVLLAVLTLSRIFWTPYSIQSGSMKPTLLIGDVVVAWRLDRSADRGDVMVFRDPNDGMVYVARVIGVGGDTVQMRNGLPVINGVPATQTAMDAFVEPMTPQGPWKSLPRCSNGAVGYGASCQKDQFTETLPGDDGAHRVLSALNNGPMDNTPIFTVPDGHLFFMGDNRDNSRDSRISANAGGLGFVPKTAVIGRVGRILYAFKGDGPAFIWTWSPSRIFRSIE